MPSLSMAKAFSYTVKWTGKDVERMEQPRFQAATARGGAWFFTASEQTSGHLHCNWNIHSNSGIATGVLFLKVIEISEDLPTVIDIFN